MASENRVVQSKAAKPTSFQVEVEQAVPQGYVLSTPLFNR